ncbi:PEP-CTERM sorting domain-containing protein [Massilia luteola]|uniref:PEP-CTERM sorting domain-containing protein n=1 Tax=Massilia luteola TaxID=3081751 RepID=UPI002ACBF95E|nr:PEP-CTERM sorting domain-containing protein [Massilia sp. Gc5]
MFGKLSLSVRWLGALVVLLFSQWAAAGPIAIGYMSFDVTSGTTAQFDIANLTGPNALAPDFPVATPLTFSALNLLVTFSDGTNHTFGLSDFTLSVDGMSLDGPTVAIGGTTLPVAATLSGLVGPTSIDPGTGTMMDIDAAFSPVMFGDIHGPALDDGALGVIYVHEPGTVTVPEPSSAWLIVIGAAAFGLRRRARSAALVALLAGAGTASASIPVKLAAASIPSSGVVGVSFVKVTAMGLPAVAPASVMMTIAPTCAVGGPVAGQVVTPASSIIPVIGSTSQVRFQIPAALSQGTYYVSLSGGSGAGAFASTNCSVLNVTTSNTTLNSCLPTSSLAVALGPTVTAYVPNGWWGGGATGIQVVPIEGAGAPASIPTAAIVNSCSSNPSTGQAVCTANTNDVYLINGHTLTNTLLSSATGNAFFSGGGCRNCGVAVNGLTNTAYITVGLSDSASGSGIQALNLATNAFGAPLRLRHIVSENISVDAGRNLLLTPGEDNSYGLVRLSSVGDLLTEFENSTIGGGGEYDSSASDCTTGIALASNEFTSNVSMADLNQASFIPGSGSGIGSWTSPHNVVTLDGSFAAGISGISVAPGGQHMGILTGEFGGQSFAVFQLPATPATGGTVPALVDYAVVNNLPNTPDGASFTAGFDPHTITAYTSPNDGRAYGVIADWAIGTPSWLAVIDLKKIQGAPRIAGTHTVDTSVYDVLASGAVRYVAVH